MANYQEDIYTAFRSALDTIGHPATFQGYVINYYDKTYQDDYKAAVKSLLPTSGDEDDEILEDDLIVDGEEIPKIDLIELKDTNQAEIICDINWTVEQKLKVMRELVALIPIPKIMHNGMKSDTVIPKTVVDKKYIVKKPKPQPVEPVDQLAAFDASAYL